MSIRIHYLIFILTGVVACSPVRVVSTELEPGVQSRDYQSYNFYDVKVQAAESAPTSPQRIEMLKSAISRELEAVGLERANNPDVWVNIGIVVEDKVQTRETDIRDAPIYIGQRNYHWEVQEVVVDEYREGTVTIDLVDAADDEMVGQAIATGVIVENEEKLRKRIDEGMAKVFDELWNNSSDAK